MADLVAIVDHVGRAQIFAVDLVLVVAEDHGDVGLHGLVGVCQPLGRDVAGGMRGLHRFHRRPRGEVFALAHLAQFIERVNAVPERMLCGCDRTAPAAAIDPAWYATAARAPCK